MAWVLIVIGLSRAAMLALGCNVIVPLTSKIAGLCDLMADIDGGVLRFDGRPINNRRSGLEAPSAVTRLDRKGLQ
jgi:hypothetical protein